MNRAPISDSDIMDLERKNILNRCLSISFLSSHGNVIQLEDERNKGRIIEVYIRNYQLWCNFDEKFDCVHVEYVKTLKQVKSRLDS
jgi:hypothetical protein